MQSFPIILKQLREDSNVTQDELAKQLHIPRSTIAGYEAGKKHPRIERLLQLSKYFKKSVDFLLTGKDKTNDRILAITVDKDNNENIEFVPVKAAAGYLRGSADEEFIKSLKKFNIPNLSVGTYRAFEIKGDSMPPFEDGVIVIGKAVDDTSIKDGHRYVIVEKVNGIVFKRIMKKSKSLLAISDNTEYKPFEIEKANILEMWEFCSYISFVPIMDGHYESIAQKLAVIDSKLNKLL